MKTPTATVGMAVHVVTTDAEVLTASTLQISTATEAGTASASTLIQDYGTRTDGDGSAWQAHG